MSKWDHSHSFRVSALGSRWGTVHGVGLSHFKERVQVISQDDSLSLRPDALPFLLRLYFSMQGSRCCAGWAGSRQTGDRQAGEAPQL